MFFEVRTKRLSVTEDNAYKTIKESWLLEAINYTEAEKRIHEYMDKNFPKEDLKVDKISTSRVCNVRTRNDGTPIWKAKFLVKEENDKGKVKKFSHVVAVDAEDANKANPAAENFIADLWNTEKFEVVKVEKTKFAGVILRDDDETKKELEKAPKSKK